MNVDAFSIYRTRLKEQIIAHIPELEQYNKGKEIWFIHTQIVEVALATAFDAQTIVKTAMTIKKGLIIDVNLLESSQENFNG